MPVSFWGFLTYGLLAAVAWNRYADNQWRWAWVISFFGLLFSLYLTAIAFFELKAACPYCLTPSAYGGDLYNDDLAEAEDYRNFPGVRGWARVSALAPR